MTIQTLFDRMMLYDNQLDLIAGGDDVTRGLTAVNLVQDWWEAAAAEIEGCAQTYADSITTTANQEYTTWPATLARLDDLYLLDSSGRQVRKLEPIDVTGGHRPNMPWPIDQVTGSYGTGSPAEYYARSKSGRFLWAPTPDAVYTLRAYGLWRVSDYTAAADTFGYDDDVALLMAPHATQVFRMGLSRDVTDVQQAAEAAFSAAARTMTRSVRTGAQSRVFHEVHDT